MTLVEGSLYQCTKEIFWVKGGTRRPFLNDNIFASWGIQPGSVNIVDCAVLFKAPLGKPMQSRICEDRIGQLKEMNATEPPNVVGTCFYECECERNSTVPEADRSRYSENPPGTVFHQRTVPWVAYEAKDYNVSRPNCPSFYNATRPLTSVDMYKWKMWPGIADKFDAENGETIYGFKEAMGIIYEAQNPRNCSAMQFVISNGFQSGFGSRLHLEGIGLAIALQLGRVYVPRDDSVSWSWETKVKHCSNQKKSNIYCYYEEWSHCSLADALQGEDIDKIRRINTYVDVPIDIFTSEASLRDYRAQLASSRVVVIELIWDVRRL